VTSPFTTIILEAQWKRGAKDTCLRPSPSKLEQALDLTEIDDFANTLDAEVEDATSAVRGIALVN